MGLLTEAEVQAMTDKEIVDAVADNVHGAAFFSRMTDYDRNCGILYKEALRRKNESLYERGYRRAENQLLPR